MSIGLTRVPARRTATARAAGEVGRLADAALRVSQVVYLGVLWLVACLPLVTIPAATVALVARMRAWRLSGQEPSARDMAREMRTAFARRTLAMLLVAAILAVLAVDLRAIGLAPAGVRPAALTAWFAVSIAVAMLTVHVPAVLAADDVGCAAAIRRSARAAVLRPSAALAAVAALAAAAVVLVSAPVSAPLLAVAVAWVLDRAAMRAPLPSNLDERNDDR